MKNIKIYILGLLLIGLSTSCDRGDFTGEAEIVPVEGITASIDLSDMQATYAEMDEDTFRVTLTLSAPQSTADVVVYASQIGGDATLGEDGDFDFIDEDGLGVTRKVIPALSGKVSTTWTIIILNDCIAEGVESFELQFGDERTANVAVTPQTKEASITNFVSDIPAIVMEWGTNTDGEALALSTPEENLSVADDIDMDLLLLDSELGLINNFAAATGANPEIMPFSADAGGTVELPNGTYYLLVDQYSSFATGSLDPIEYPLFFNFERCGGSLAASDVFEGYDTEGYYNQEDESYTSDVIAYEVTKTDAGISISDGVVEIGAGKIEMIRAAINANKK